MIDCMGTSGSAEDQVPLDVGTLFDNFKRRYQKVPVVEVSNDVDEHPFVSVCIQTYNHENYIEDCIDSILNQDTYFPFEILIGEDGSDDRTRSICIDYARKYPNIIRLFLHDRRNNIQIEGKPTGRFNFLYNVFSARGKYIAFCEGDDFWTSNNKLQKQVMYLESNESFTLICTDYSECTTDGTLIRDRVWGQRDSVLSNSTIIEKYKPKLCTALVRLKLLRDSISPGSIFYPNYDNVIFAAVTLNGPAYYLNEATSCYRKTGEGMWSGLEILTKYEMQANTFMLMLRDEQFSTVRRSIYARVKNIAKVIIFISLVKLRIAMLYRGIRFWLGAVLVD